MKKVLLILVILTIPFLGGCFKKVGKDVTRLNELKEAEQQLSKDYKDQVDDILNPLFDRQSSAGIKDQLLELRVPSEFLQVHLNLVLALDLIEQGEITADQSLVEDGLEKINQLKSEYKWID